MAAFTGARSLQTIRLNRIIGTLAAKLEIERPLVYLDRLALVPAFDDELVGRFVGKIIAADLIADDQEAVVQESMSLELVTHTIPNIKIGQRLGQKLLERIAQLEANPPTNGENALKDWDMKVAENLLLGVRWRMNALACAMMTDAFTYDRLGIKISGGTWGMPSALKITVGTAWSTASTATPLSDIWGADQVARLTYGIEYDTVTMGSVDFRLMVATTEFAQRASLSGIGGYFLLSSSALQTKNDPVMREIAAKVVGKTIIVDDAVYNTRNNAGTVSSTRVLPVGTVLLSRKQDEKDPSIMDMANGTPTEARVANLIGGAPEGLGGEGGGPLAYYTGRADLNPPDVTAWGVARAFPRKHVPEATAVLLGVSS